MLLGLSLIPVNMFWLLSLYKNGENILSLEVSSLELTSLLNSFSFINLTGQVIFMDKLQIHLFILH